MRKLTLFLMTTMVGALIALALVSPASKALAYQGCQGDAVASASPVNANGGDSITIIVVIHHCDGSAAQGVLVIFGQQSGPANCVVTFDPPSAVTDANGVAHTTVKLPSGCPCQYVISASGSVDGQPFTVTTPIRENGCLPFTGAAATQPLTPPIGLALVIAGMVVIAGSAFALRRA